MKTFIICRFARSSTWLPSGRLRAKKIRRRENMKYLYHLTVVAAILLLLSGCAKTGPVATPIPPTAPPTPLPTPSATLTLTPVSMPTITYPVTTEKISLTTKDNIRLAATLFVGGQDAAVVLAHMGIDDQTSWQAFAKTVAGRGFTALTFDFRCFGESDCSKLGTSEHLHAEDMRAAIEFLRSRGLERIVCMGASLGGTICLNAALEENLAGLVVIASVGPTNLYKQYPKDLVNPGMPKLFIVTEKDRYAQVVSGTRFLYTSSPEPKTLKTFPGRVHGTELFNTDYRGEFRDMLVNFMIDASLH